MSRAIDHDAPFSEEDKEYLRTRPGGEASIAINERKFGHLDDEGKQAAAEQKQADDQKDAEIDAQIEQEIKDSELPWDDDIAAKVAEQSIASLRQYVDKHKIDVPKTDDSDAELQALQNAVADHLQAARNAKKG